MKEEKATEYTYKYDPDPDLDPAVNAAESMRMDHLRVGMGPTTEQARARVLNTSSALAIELSVHRHDEAVAPPETAPGEQGSLWPGVPGWPGTTYNGRNGEAAR